MNGNRESIAKLVTELNRPSLPPSHKVETVVAPPFIYIDYVNHRIRPEIRVAAQNCSSELKGAFTGEVSTEMLRDCNVLWVILGHSERRTLFNESSELVGRKVALALATGLKVIACVGERLEDRESNQTFGVIHSQLEHIAANVRDWSSVVIAYEPVWAIGTGKSATPAQAQEVHAGIRSWLSSHVADQNVSHSTRIIYGGSVKGSNANELALQPDIDGFLVGGASLIASDFVEIINSSLQKI